MKGWRTFAFGLAVAIVPPAVTYLGGVDWTAIGVAPPVSAGIGLAIIALRAVTTTALGQKS